MKIAVHGHFNGRRHWPRKNCPPVIVPTQVVRLHVNIFKQVSSL